ncbi:MAG: hypothetical protein K2Z81_12105, partial [Cyanobacteria bacterium]|nr:hypothetical protein [Cyanobacteriota bacterium]
KTQSSQQFGQIKELGVDTSHADEKGVFLVDKNKEQQLEPGKDAPASEIRGGKSGSGVTEANSPDGKRSQDADLTPGTSDKGHIPLGSEQGAVASSRGMLGDGRSDNASDAAVAISDKSGPRVIISLGDLKVDLSSPDMSKKLLDVLTQIQSGKVTAADPISKAFALELLSSKSGVDSILAAHDSKNLELVKQLLSDKLPPDVALDRFKAQWENPQLKTENELLKQKLKERDNVVEVAVREVRKSFSNILRVVVDVFQKKNQELPEPPMGTLLENFMTQTDPIAVIKEEKVRVLSRLTSLGDSILVQSSEKEATEETKSSTTVCSQSQDEYGSLRTQYIVKADETYESIALEQFGNECYGQLIESINESYATTRDDGEYGRHELVEGEILNMPTEKEREEYLDPLLKGTSL